MKSNLKRQCLKLVMLFVGLFALSGVAMAGQFNKGQKLFVKFTDGWVTDAGASIWARFDGNNSNDRLMTRSSDYGNDIVFYCEVPVNASQVEFRRCESSTSAASAWNRTGNLNAPDASSENMATVSGLGNPGGNVSWSPATVWNLLGSWDSTWATPKKFDYQGNNIYKLTYRYNGEEFKINNSDGEWYRTENDLVNGTPQSNLGDYAGNMKLSDDANGKLVEFTLTIGTDGKASSFVATWGDTYTFYSLKKYVDGSDESIYTEFAWNPAENAYTAILKKDFCDQFHIVIATEEWEKWKSYGWYSNGQYYINNSPYYGFEPIFDSWAIVSNSDADYKVKLYCIDGEGSLPVRIEFERIVDLDNDYTGTGSLYVFAYDGANTGLIDFSTGEMTRQIDGSYTYLYNYKPSQQGNGNLQFRFYNKEADDKTTWGDPADTSNTTNAGTTISDEWKPLKAYANSDNWWRGYNFKDENYEGYITIIVSPDLSNVKVVKGNYIPGMPFYPNGVNSEYAFNALDRDQEYYYLVGHSINNGLASPEWQMVDASGDGSKYTIDFTFVSHETEKDGCNENGLNDFLNTNDMVKVVAYTPMTSEPYGVSEKKKIDLIHKTLNGNSYAKAGMRVRASYYPETKKLEFSPIDFDGIETDEENAAYLPMVSLIGKEWVQDSKVPRLINVPAGDTRFGNDWDKTINDDRSVVGWQQSWIQYDENGEAVISRDGSKVFFNTQWPPLNDVMFVTKDKDGNELTLSSGELTFTTEGEQGNAEYWKKNGFGGVDFSYDENAEYVLYKVSDMWITGDFKLWSGWSGARLNDTGTGAEWNWNWGHYSQLSWPNTWNLQSTDDNNRELLDGKDPELADGNGTVHLGIADGDMTFDKPTYFSNVYFFFDLSHPNNNDSDGAYYNRHCLLYFERGDISILAQSKDYTYGMFTPSLNYIDEGTTLKTITLKVYKNNEDKDLVATLIDKVPVSINTPEEFTKFFADRYKKGVTDALRLDGIEDYASGYYYYTLEADVENELNGQMHLYAKSNPFRIYKEEVSHTLTAAQLIKLPKEGSVFSKYDYITYSPTYNNRLVKVETKADGSETVTAIDNVTSISHTQADIDAVYELTGEWTNKTLLRTTLPDSYDKLNVARKTFESFSLAMINDTDVTDRKIDFDVVENGEYFATIQDHGTEFGTTTYESRINAKVRVEATDDAKSIEELDNIKVTHGKASYTPSFMLPAFGKATLSFDKEGSVTGNTVYTASHDDLKYDADGDVKQQTGVSTNRHMLQADIEVLMPNVEGAIRNAVFNQLAGMQVNDCAINTVRTDEDYAYGLSYKYQNPYDWMRQTEDGNWEGITNSWSMTAQYPEGKINGIVRTLSPDGTKAEGYNPFEVSLTAAPHFSAPEINMGTLDFSFDADKMSETGIFELYLKNIEINLNLDDDKKDDLNPADKAFTKFSQDDNTVFLVKLTSTDKNVTSYISKVMDYNGGISNGTEPIFVMPAGPSKDNDNYSFTDITNALTDLQIEVAYAYYFSAGGEAGYQGEEGDHFDAAASTSGWVGFEGDFPYMRSDHQTSTAQNAPRRAVAEEGGYPEISDKMKDRNAELMNGDNAFLLAPVYAIVKLSGEDNMEEVHMPTGVVSISDDSDAAIIVGKGYIDLNGNEGVIYSADGRVIYSGNGRAQMAQGVYVVSFGSHSVRVLVK